MEVTVSRLRSNVIIVLALALCTVGQSAKYKRPPGNGKIVAQEVVLSGTTTLNSTQLTDISNALSSVTMHDDDQEVEERIKYQFQQHGYFDAEVTNLKVIPLDPLAKKKGANRAMADRDKNLFSGHRQRDDRAAGNRSRRTSRARTRRTSLIKTKRAIDRPFQGVISQTSARACGPSGAHEVRR